MPQGSSKITQRSEALLNAALDQACDASGRRRIETCHIGADAAARQAEFMRAKNIDSCLIVADPNTYGAAGPVLDALTKAGIKTSEWVLEEEAPDATDTLGDEVTSRIGKVDAVVGIGSGTICDLAKYAGDKTGKPALAYATAASMNGYTSGIVAIKVNGLKRTVPCRPLTGVFANPEVFSAASQRMTAAGFADYISKCSASADWAAAHFLRGEYYDPNALQFYEGILDKVLARTDRIGSGDPDTIATVMEALLLSGLSMLVAGSSAPASGGEHLISHYIDMRASLNGTPHDLHGVQVGVATCYCLALWEKVVECEPADMDIDALIDAHPSAETIDEWITEDWGAVAEEVRSQWCEKALDRESLRQELTMIRDRHQELCAAVKPDLKSSVMIAAAIQESGGPTLGNQLEVPLDEYINAKARARFIRNRFTILDLAAELGIDA